MKIFESPPCLKFTRIHVHWLILSLGALNTLKNLDTGNMVFDWSVPEDGQPGYIELNREGKFHFLHGLA